MTRQTPAPLSGLSFNTTNRSARELARLVLDGSMTLDAPYQRGEVWNEDQRIALVRSWLMGLPIPAVIVNDRMTYVWKDANPDYSISRDPNYAAVDGKQRLLTAAAWFNGDLAVPASWFDTADVEATVDTADGPYVRYPDLVASLQRHIAFTWLMPLAEAKVPTVQAEAEVYLIVNGGGTPQSPADLDNARRVANT